MKGTIKIMQLKLIGYWNNEQNHYPKYPHPKNLVSPDFYRLFCSSNYITKEYISTYLDNGITCNRTKGFSTCRICGKYLGSYERHDTVYIWPDKLSHYIIDHNVRLPIRFLMHILDADVVMINVDHTEWINEGTSNA